MEMYVRYVERVLTGLIFYFFVFLFIFVEEKFEIVRLRDCYIEDGAFCQSTRKASE